jgi:hypothetical protein
MLALPIGVTVACPAYVRTPLAEGLVTLIEAYDDAWTERLPAELLKKRKQERATLKWTIVTMIEPEFPAERILATVEIDQLYALPWIGPGKQGLPFPSAPAGTAQVRKFLLAVTGVGELDDV